MSARPSPSGDLARQDDGSRPWVLIAVVIGLFAVRLGIGGTIHLTEDEAYYRLWAQAPALGYFDHPPMIAWWIWAGVHLMGDTPLGVRSASILACVLTTILVHDMTRLAGGNAEQAQRAGLWFNAMPLVTAGGFLAVPDAAASLFWALCLWCALRANRGEGIGWWLAVGLAAGLASLSKYSALFLGPGVLLWLVSTRAGRSSLRRPGPWLALAVAAGVFGLNAGWNATHDWLTFTKQFGRITPHQWAPRYLLEFLATEILLVNPVLAIVVACIGFVPRLDRSAATVTPFLLTSLPFVAYLLVHSLHDRIQAHWPAPIYPALAICAALTPSGGPPFWVRVRAAGPVIGFGLTAIAAMVIAATGVGLHLRHDPMEPIRGWPRFASRVEALRRQEGGGWVGTASYGVAAQLADESSIASPILQLSERSRWRGLKLGVSADVSRPGILVDLPRRIDLDALRRCFADVRTLGPVLRGDGNSIAGDTTYQVVFLARPTVDIVRKGCDSK